MRKVAYLIAIAVLVCAAPVFAQGPFTDVPTDHWAYDAVNQLQKEGLIIGYPDGTFGGKRTLTRYEFAVALARLYEALSGKTGTTTTTTTPPVDLSNYATKADLANLATKADVEALRKLIDEFRDELAALGVDVDALKRDVAALAARVDALEAEVRRVRLFGDTTVFAITDSQTGGAGTAIDMDQRVDNSPLFRGISYVQDFDLKVVGRVAEGTTATAVINYGNYLNYLGYVDDYIDNARPTTKSAVGIANKQNTLSDAFFPYYLYIDTGVGFGALTVGRFPIQFTPYTLKKIDVDSYTTIAKTSNGDYPMDGAKLAFDLFGADFTLFAAKNNENDYLKNGLTGQPNGGLYGRLSGTAFGRTFVQIQDVNPGGLSGNAVGGLSQVSQSAGVRGTIHIPWGGILGGTFYQAWDENAFNNGASAYDQARVWGADLTLPIPFLTGLNLTGSYTESSTLAKEGVVGFSDIDYQNAAIDGKLSYGFGKLGLGAGYKTIGRNFAAAGYWDKIGRWTNPTDIKGPYVDLAYPFSDTLKVVLNGEFLKAKDTVTGTVNGVANTTILGKDDDITKAEAAVTWGFSPTNTLDLSYQWVRFDPTNVEKSTEQYITVGVGHQINPNAAIRVAYQVLSYDGAASLRPYFNDYNGGVGVVQFGVSF